MLTAVPSDEAQQLQWSVEGPRTQQRGGLNDCARIRTRPRRNRSEKLSGAVKLSCSGYIQQNRTVVGAGSVPAGSAGKLLPLPDVLNVRCYTVYQGDGASPSSIGVQNGKC